MRAFTKVTELAAPFGVRFLLPLPVMTSSQAYCLSKERYLYMGKTYVLRMAHAYKYGVPMPYCAYNRLDFGHWFLKHPAPNN